MPGFQINARNFFVTYPQSTALPHGLVHQHLTDFKEGNVVYSCREPHEDGEFHHHAFVQFARRYNCRNERAFDIEHEGRIFHPNIQPVKSIQGSNTYIGKNRVTLGEPIATVGEERRNVYAELLGEATDARSFMQLAEERDTKNFVLNHDRLESFAAKRWGKWEEPEEPEFVNFSNVPEEMTNWVNDELNGNVSRPKNLVIVGGAELGKTSWARSLGNHHYWINRFTGQRTRNAKYAVLDDFDHLEKERADFKGIFGSQRKVGVKVGNGISGHRTWDWGIPSIFLFNELPDFLGNPASYERNRCVFVYLNRPLY